ncbi:unnamed protein product, partial [marine sediment metagenome]
SYDGQDKKNPTPKERANAHFQKRTDNNRQGNMGNISEKMEKS